MRKLDLTWRAVSRAIDLAYRKYPNQVLAELLSFLSLEGLGATLRFDDATVRLAGGKLPKDVTDDLAKRFGEALRLDPEQLVAWPEWQPHVIIFKSFEAVGNIEVYLYGEPPELHVQTLISLGTATPRHNLLSMPDQISRLLQNLERQWNSSLFGRFSTVSKHKCLTGSHVPRSKSLNCCERL